MNRLLVCLLLMPLAWAAPLQLLVIGDSQSEEYAFELPFTAPDSNPIQANTKNWVEILHDRRPDQVTFGSYAPDLLTYAPTLRNAGFELNWGVPGFETGTWAEVVSATIFQDQGYLPSKAKLIEQLPNIDAIVIILGGNDANGDYRALQNNTPPSAWADTVVSNLRTIIDYVRDSSSKPILLANIPDVGATQLVQEKFPDPNKRAIATALIQQANQAIADLAAEKSAVLLNFFAITERLVTDGPIRIGEVEFLPSKDANNKPRFLLCKDGFHPATATQCLIANLVLEGLELPPLSDEEILQDSLGIPVDTDSAYLQWISAATTRSAFRDDPDGDGLPNLGEYALDKDPLKSDAPLFEFTPVTDRASYVTTRPMRSDDLINWQPSESNPMLPFFRLEFDLIR